MKVYRWENPKTGIGPYTDEKIAQQLGLNEETKPTQPVPAFDNMQVPHGRMLTKMHSFDAAGDWLDALRFGFSSMTQGKHWFTPANVEALQKAGYVLESYDVAKADVCLGGHQCAFAIDYAKKIGPVQP